MSCCCAVHKSLARNYSEVDNLRAECVNVEHGFVNAPYTVDNYRLFKYLRAMI